MTVKAAVLAVTASAAMAVLSGCGNVKGANLLFGQQQSVGLNMSASTTDQGTSVHLGFKDQDIAIVPVAVPDTNADGKKSMTLIHGESQSKEQDAGGRNLDALSVFGQFDLDAGAGTGSDGANVTLGKFFATGVAATSLADGYKQKLTNTAGDSGESGGQ